MSSRAFWIFALALFAGWVPPSVSAQTQAEPLPYVYVSQWTIPRAQWAEFETYADKSVRPVFEKLMADGTLQSWGLYATAVHVEEYPTHGAWFQAASIADVMKALAELSKLPANPIVNAPTSKHRDYLLHAQMTRWRTASGSNGLLWVNNTHLQPGKGSDYRALYGKFVKPVLDGLLADGTLVLYGMEGETIHTADPSQIFLVYFFSSPDGLDKLYAAIGAMEEKNTTFAAALGATEVGPPHRDYLARVLSYAVK